MSTSLYCQMLIIRQCLATEAMQKKKSLGIKMFQFKFSSSCVFMLFHDMVTQTPRLFMFLNWSLTPFHVFELVTQTFSCFWHCQSNLFMFLTWSFWPFHVFQLATQTYSCFWHGHSDLFKFWHGHSDLFLFMTWSLRPSYVFDLVNQTYSCFWHGHLDLSMFFYSLSALSISS